MNIFTLNGITVLAVASQWLHAQPALILTEKNLANRIHAQNPTLQAARMRIQEAVGNLHQAGKPSRPRLEIDAEAGPGFREANLDVGISASFPVTNRLKWEKEISKAELEAAQQEVRQVEQSLIAQAREQFFKALKIKSHGKLLESQKTEAQEFAEQIGKTAAKAEASVLDAGQAKLEAAMLLIEMRQNEAESIQVHAELKKILGMQAGQAIAIGGELPEIIPAKSGNLTNRADYQQALREVTVAQNKLGFEQVNRYDDLEAGVFLSGMRREDAPEGLKKDLMVGVQLSIPLPFWNDNAGAIESAKAGVERKKREVTALVQSARHEVAAANEEMRQWQKLEQQITLELMPLAKAQAVQAEDAYRKGQTDLQSVFRAKAQNRQLAISLLQARSEYHIARIHLESATATKP